MREVASGKERDMSGDLTRFSFGESFIITSINVPFSFGEFHNPSTEISPCDLFMLNPGHFPIFIHVKLYLSAF